MTDYDEQFERELEAMKDDGSIVSIDDDGMIRFNFQLLEILHPALYELVWNDVEREIDQSIRNLMNMGLIEMSFREEDDGKLEAVYALTDAGRAYVEGMALGDEYPSFPLDE